ncbi:MAG: menaquinone-dependent protoporphyrinogen IX dehydrogenase [Pirellulales bacterium]|nr:menaquinone-dependent protoporphyrinogen IX dehydrogenase [Pirellulales bacterium]
MRTLVLYATGEGQTKKIAEHIVARLKSLHFPADLHHVADEEEEPVALDAYDAVIVGSPMHYSHYDSRLAKYLQDYSTALADIPSAFFSVSLGIMSDKEDEQNEIKASTDAYLNETGWDPPIKKHFAGALVYSKYGWLKRQMMKMIVRRGGGPTNTNYDYEFTDWPQVERFVDEFAEFVNSCKQPDGQRRHHSLYSEPTRQYSMRNRQAAEG